MCRLQSSPGDHPSVLSDQLTSCREQVKTLQSELTIYQKLLEDVKRGKGVGSRAKRGESSQVDGAAGGGEGGVALDGRAWQLLGEVSALREQLDSSIHSNNTLAEKLRTQLDHTSSVTESHTSLGGGTLRVSYTNKPSGTTGPRMKERGSGDHTHQRSVLTQHTTKSTSASGVGTGECWGALVHVSSLSAIHIAVHELHVSPCGKPLTDLSLCLIHVSPCCNNVAWLSYAGLSSPRLSPRPARHRTSSDTQHNLASSSTSSFLSSHGSARPHEGGAGPQPPRSTHLTSSFSLQGFGDFESLESKLQKALDSPTLQVRAVGVVS